MLAVIPARGGSKGVPGKNIKPLGGKPLIHYAIEAARKIVPDSHILVSTDDEEIKEVVEAVGLKVPFLRPKELASDTSGSYEVLLHALDFANSIDINPEKIVLLQPTSPFRTGKHLKDALKLYNDSVDMIVGVKETSANPYYVLREEDEEGYLVKSKEGNFNRRQDCPKVWEINGAVYIINTASLKKTSISEFKKIKKFEMDDISSHDIDTNLDWLLAEVIFRDFIQSR